MSRALSRTIGLTRIAAITGVAALLAAPLACGAIIGTRDLSAAIDDGGAIDAGDTPHDGNVIGPDGAVNPPHDGGDGAVAPPDGTAPDDGSTSCVGADLQSNKHNCGACGHDCLGGDCIAAACQPFTLVAGQSQAQGITVDATQVYWTTTNGGQVAKANLDGSGVVILSTEASSAPWEIAVDDTAVYWTNVNAQNATPPGRVERCAKTGCPSGPTFLTGPVREAYAIAVDGVSAYWSEWDNGAIGRANKGDGGASGYLATAHGFVSGIAIDNGTIYFTSSNEVGAVAANGSLVAAYGDTATAPFRVIYNSPGTGEFDPYGIAVDDTNVYWANQSIIGGAVLYAPKGGTTTAPVTLSAHDVSPTHVALDATNIYWIAIGPNSTPNGTSSTYVSGYLATCPKTGCPGGMPIVLAKDLHNPRGLAVDAAAIYFTIHGNPFSSNPTEGAVMKLAK